MKKKVLIKLLVVALLVGAAVYSKGKARYFAFRLEWLKPYPVVGFATGSGWACSVRNEYESYEELKKIVDGIVATKPVKKVEAVVKPAVKGTKK